MKAYEVGDYSTTAKVRLVERADPMPSQGQVLIRVHSTGPNARDFQIMSSGIWAGPPSPSLIPLCDVAGEILAVGPEVTGFAAGDRVTMTHYWQWLDGPWDESMKREDHAQTLDGFLRERAVVPAAALLKIPAYLSFEEASTLPSAGLTAWQAVIETGRTRAGETLVTLGTGGVSVFAVQWAKMAGARVIVTSSSDAKIARMQEIGADAGINYRTNPEWYKKVLELTDGRGADIVINNVGMSELDQCLESCASGARVMFVGATPVTPDRQAIAAEAPRRLGLLIIRDLTLKGIVVGSRRMFQNMLDAMVVNKIHPVIDRRFSFDAANEALAYAAKADKIGKVVINI